MSKRGGETGGDSESAKKQKMGDDGQSDAALSPFAEATKFRSFKLIIEGNSIFVNPHLLGDFSPFFDTLCLGSFAEAQKGEAELKDAKYDDVIEMLLVLGADTENVNKKINISNCVPMLYMADKWNIKVLLKKCILFMENKFPSIPTNLAVTMKFLIGCEKCSLPDSALHKVASRLAAFGRVVLAEQQIHRAITNQKLYGAIVCATEIDWHAHSWHSDHIYAEPYRECYAPNCDGKGGQCVHCWNFVCRNHGGTCPTRTSEYKTAKNEELDSVFFKTWWNDKLCWDDETNV